MPKNRDEGIGDRYSQGHNAEQDKGSSQDPGKSTQTLKCAHGPSEEGHYQVLREYLGHVTSSQLSVMDTERSLNQNELVHLQEVLGSSTVGRKVMPMMGIHPR